MDLDTNYPELSSLAQSQGYTLNRLGAFPPNSDEKYLGFGSCCNFVLNNYPYWEPGNPYNYLATLNEFLRKLQPERSVSEKIWKKLTGGSPSVFLDTVTEAVWALYFLDNGKHVFLEKSFDPSNPKSKDADMVVTLDGKECWLDALSVGPNIPRSFTPLHEPRSIARLPIEKVITNLANRAKEKYRRKFKEAVKSGLLSSSGILLCILKIESEVIPQYVVNRLNNIETTPPVDLFGDKNPGLDRVWVHTFRPCETYGLLRPFSIVKWSKTGNE